MEFRYLPPTGRVTFGRGAARTRVRAELDELGLRRVLVVAGSHDGDLVRDVVARLGDLVVGTFDGVEPHVPRRVAEAARAAATATSADGLLAIGGGSTIGTAKAVALASGLPIVAIPTTYAGSETTPVWGMTTDARKETGRDPVVLPRSIVYDPDLTRGLPTELAGASAINAIAHCVEAFWAPAANPLSSLQAAEGIRLLARGARGVVSPDATDDDHDDVLLGCYLAGASFAVAGSGLHHRICHALGGAFDLPHAQTHAVVLPHVLAFNAASVSSVTTRIARALDVDDAVTGLRALGRDLGAPRDLEEVGLRADQLTEAIDVVAARLPVANPRPVSRDDVAAILTAAFSGTHEEE